MALGRYSVLTLIGSAVWCFALAGIGLGLGKSYETFHNGFRFVDYAIAAAAVGLVVYLVVRIRRSSRLSGRAPDSTG